MVVMRGATIVAAVLVTMTIVTACSESTPRSDGGIDAGGERCARARDCPEGTVCLASFCEPVTECMSSRMCPGLVCDTARGVCVECRTDPECAPEMRCRSGVCEPPPPTCATDRDCSAMALVCDTDRGECVECVVNADCAATESCSDRSCVPRTEVDAGMVDASIDDAGGDDDGGVDSGIDAGAEDSGPGDAGPPRCLTWELGGIGVPAGSRATASATFEPYGPENTIDGDILTLWNSASPTGSITLELSRPVSITGIRLAADASPPSDVTYTVLLGPTEIGRATFRVAGSSSMPMVLPVLPVTPGSYARLTITVDTGSVSWAEITEVSLITPECP
jgi:hypothetical protein